MNELLCACEKGDEHKVFSLLNKGEDVQQTNACGWTPLHEAARAGQNHIVRLLLGRGAPIDKTDNYDQTPLHLATWLGRESTVKLLLSAGARKDLKTKSGRTALDWAIERNYTSIAHLLQSSLGLVVGPNPESSSSSTSTKSTPQTSITIGGLVIPIIPKPTIPAPVPVAPIAPLVPPVPVTPVAPVPVVPVAPVPVSKPQAKVSSNTVTGSAPAVHRLLNAQQEPLDILSPIRGIFGTKDCSLKDAVKSLSFIPDVADDAEAAMLFVERLPTTNSVYACMTFDEMAAIRLYTFGKQPPSDSFYDILNTRLRTADRTQLIPFFPYLKLLLSGLKALSPFQGTVYRGFTGKLGTCYATGQKVIWWGVTSCTRNLAAIQAFLGQSGDRVFFTIEIQTGVDIKTLSAFPKEEEVLLPPATWFMVKGLCDAGHGLTMVQLEQCSGPNMMT